jgi:hypothetical protein
MEGRQLPSLHFVIMPGIMRKFHLHLFPLFLLFVSACGNQPVPTQAPITTSAATASRVDKCSAENLPSTVEGINDLMREFDEASQLASTLPAQQLPDVISDLQRIRRATEDIQIPVCLTALKTHQLNHMNVMIQTLISFVGGADQEGLKNGLEAARKEHDLYSLEIVRLLGITLEPITATSPAP